MVLNPTSIKSPQNSTSFSHPSHTFMIQVKICKKELSLEPCKADTLHSLPIRTCVNVCCWAPIMYLSCRRWCPKLNTLLLIQVQSQLVPIDEPPRRDPSLKEWWLLCSPLLLLLWALGCQYSTARASRVRCTLSCVCDSSPSVESIRNYSMSLEINKYTNTCISSQWLRSGGKKKPCIHTHKHKSKGKLLYLLVCLSSRTSERF